MFPQKTGFDISCKLSPFCMKCQILFPLEIICTKCQSLFPGKIKKIIQNVLLKILPRVLSFIQVGGGPGGFPGMASSIHLDGLNT